MSRSLTALLALLVLASCGQQPVPRLKPPGETLDVTLTWNSYRVVPGSEKPDGTGEVEPYWDWRLRCAPDGTFTYTWRRCEAPSDAPWQSLTGRWEHKEGAKWLLLPDHGPSIFVVEQTGESVPFTLKWAYLATTIGSLENGAPYWTVPMPNLHTGQLSNRWGWVLDPRLSR